MQICLRADLLLQRNCPVGCRGKPQWRIVGDRRELDFLRSYAVQLVPSILAADRTTLLQGRIAIMRAADYDNAARAVEVAKLYKRLRSDLKRESDHDRVVVQLLARALNQKV